MDEFYIEHEFYAAAGALRIPVLKRMKAPVEQRPEGTLTAVSRMLWRRGEKTNHPDHPHGFAPSVLGQFYKEFELLKPRYLALHSVERQDVFNSETKLAEERWVFRYAYIQ